MSPLLFKEYLFSFFYPFGVKLRHIWNFKLIFKKINLQMIFVSSNLWYYKMKYKIFILRKLWLVKVWKIRNLSIKCFFERWTTFSKRKILKFSLKFEFHVNKLDEPLHLNTIQSKTYEQNSHWNLFRNFDKDSFKKKWSSSRNLLYFSLIKLQTVVNFQKL